MKGKFQFEGQMLSAAEIRQKYIPMVKTNEWVRAALRDGCTTQADLIARYTKNENRKINKPARTNPLRGTYK